MEKDKEEVKRIQIRLSKTNYQKLEQMTERYGMSINSLCGYAVGLWLDNNYDVRDRLLEKMVEMMSTPDNIMNLFTNPAFSSVFSDAIKSAFSDVSEQMKESKEKS